MHLAVLPPRHSQDNYEKMSLALEQNFRRHAFSQQPISTQVFNRITVKVNPFKTLYLSPSLSHALFCVAKPNSPRRVLNMTTTNETRGLLEGLEQTARRMWYLHRSDEEKELVASSMNYFVQRGTNKCSLFLSFSTVLSAIHAFEFLQAEYPEANVKFWYMEKSVQYP